MKKSEILKRLFTDKVITISAVDGSKTIFNSEDIFKTWIDSGFRNRDLNKPNKETSEIKTLVYEMVQDTKLRYMFKALNIDLDKLCLTQHQIIEFCTKNQKYLRKDDWTTFFLFKRKNRRWQIRKRYFVIYVCVYASSLGINVDRFNGRYVLHADSRFRLVVPQLKA